MTTPAPIIVYGRQACQPCRLTKKKLEDAAIEFRYIDVDQDHAALEGLTEQDWVTALPVVVAGDMRWCGLKLDQLKQLLDTYTPKNHSTQ